MESTSDSDLMQEFARMTLSSFKYQATDEGTNLTLSLNHSESSIRKHGVKQLLGILSKKSKVKQTQFFSHHWFYLVTFHNCFIRNAVMWYYCSPKRVSYLPQRRGF